ncbi:MAG: class I poly(R)-hydroxyalkanoic acid synthase, partial [Sphingomonas bacterium]|nr:class I poly(R)-hydroxyalkanoic acid synthase [Sphingomonas bacterium]
MTDETTTAAATPFPTLEDWQHWTWVTGRAQQMLMENWAESLTSEEPTAGLAAPAAADPMAWMTAGAEAWSKGFEAWGKMLGATAAAGERKDRRFASPEWSENPVFETIKQSYLAISDRLLGSVEEIEGIDDEARQKMRFATKSFVDAMAPSNF